MAFEGPFPQPSEQPTISFSYDDISEGTGVNLLLGFQQKETTNVTYALSKSAFYSTLIETSVNITGGMSDTPVIDLDFDLGEFKLAQTISGTARIQQGINIQGRAGETASFYVTYKIIHYDGTTETILGTATSQTVSIGSAINESHMVNIPIALTRKRFRKGDIVRVNIEVFATGVGAGNVGDATIGHDPQNRDGPLIIPSVDDVISRLEIHLPFEINQF